MNMQKSTRIAALGLVATLSVSALAVEPPKATKKRTQAVPRNAATSRRSTADKKKPKRTTIPPKPLTEASWLIPPPEPGKIVEQKTDKVSGVTDVWLANGARVHHRYMDVEPGRLAAGIAFAGGEIEETAETVGLTRSAVLIVNAGYTKKHSINDIARFMSDKDVNIACNVDRGPLSFEISGKASELEAALQKMHVLLTDGRISDAAMERRRARTLVEFQTYSKIANFNVVSQLNDLISGGDPRRMLGTEETVRAVTLPAVQKWFDRLRLEAPIEVVVVGDITLEKALPLIQRYVGTLPARPRTSPRLDKLRRINRPTGPLKRIARFESTSAQAMLLDGFLTCDTRNIEDTRTLHVASLVLDARTSKALKAGRLPSTTIRVKAEQVWRYRDSGRFTAIARCKPENVDPLINELEKLYQDFATNGPTKREVASATGQWVKYYKTEAHENLEHWMRMLQFHDMHGRDVHREDFAAVPAFKAMTPDSVRAVFNKYYKPQRRYTAAAIPKVPEVIKPKNAPKPADDKKTDAAKPKKP